MPSRLIPLFPLRSVVFPRTRLPLHIFEERYKEMVGEALRDGSEFGVVLARDEGIVSAGCSVAVEKVLQMYPDGRMDIMTVGRRRFEIESLNEEKAYLQAQVSFFDDDDLAPVPAELQQEALRHYKSLLQVEGSASQEKEPDFTDPQMSFQLAQAVPDLEFLSTLLRQRSEASRLRELSQFLLEFVPRRRTIERMNQLAPTNGHGRRAVEL
jgi:Lon protease-like protein